MTNEQTQGGEGGEGGEQPPAIDYSKILAWDEEKDGAPPEDIAPLLAHRDGLRSLIDTRIGEVAARTQQETLAAVQQQREREQRENSDRARVQEDIDWATAIEADLFSGDEARLASAKAKRDAEPTRYERALGLKHRTGETEQYNTAVTTFLNTALGAATKTHQSMVDSLTSENLAKHGGNPFIAAAEWGREQGDAVGFQRGVEEGRRLAAIENGAHGAQGTTPPLASGGGGHGAPEQFDGKNKGVGTRQIDEMFAGASRRR
ncbi:MAG: hypothetical protein IT345_10500 [Trueperaceae bacterium]|nr:hypothetical protein [Trueperaceae bacterium]